MSDYWFNRSGVTLITRVQNNFSLQIQRRQSL